MQSNPINPDSPIINAQPALSKGQRKKAKEKLKKAQNALEVEKSQQTLVANALLSNNPEKSVLSPGMADFSKILFSSISFDPTRSVIEAWGLYGIKTLKNIKNIFEKTKIDPALIHILESKFQLYYYLMQIYYHKLDCISKSHITYHTIFEDKRYFPSLEQAQGKGVSEQLNIVLNTISVWKAVYFNQTKISKQATERLWSPIERDLTEQFNFLEQVVGFMKEIVSHPKAKQLLIEAAEDNFSNAYLMVKPHVEETKEDLALLLDLMEKAIDESIKAGHIGGVLSVATVKNLNRYFKQIKDKKVIPYEDVLEFFKLQLKEEEKMDEGVLANETFINRIKDDPYFTHDVWCKENNVQKVREKTQPEFLSMMYQSYVNAMILRDFFEIFSTVLSRHIIAKADPERLKVDPAAMNKFVFGFTVVNKFKNPQMRNTFMEEIAKTLSFYRLFPLCAEFNLHPFLRQIEETIYQMFVCLENHSLDADAFKEVLASDNPTLDKLWRINRSYHTYKTTVLALNDQLLKNIASVKKGIETKIANLPFAQARERVQQLNQIFHTLHLYMTTGVAPPILVANEMGRLVHDSWATGEHKPHKNYTNQELERDLVNAIEAIFPNLTFDYLLPKEPNLKSEPVPLKAVVKSEPKPEVVPDPLPPVAPSLAAVKEEKKAEPVIKTDKKEKKVVDEKIPKSIKVRELLKLLYEEGFKGVRMRGDHLIVARGTETIAVPVTNTHVSLGVLNQIQKKVVKKE